MNYQTGYAFRRALEARLLKQSTEGSLSLVRLRKLIAFDRFLARLLAVQPDGWLLTVSYTHLRAHETVLDLVCRLLLEKKKKNTKQN